MNQTKILKFPMKEQKYNYDCGVAAAWSVLRYFGERPNYIQLLNGSGVDLENGLPPYMLVELLKYFGLDAELEEFRSIRFIKNEIFHEKPVITLFQMRKGYGRAWNKTWDYGHYIVVVGYDRNRLFIYDPWIGGMRVLTNEMFRARWHDTSEGIKYIKPCITINEDL